MMAVKDIDRGWKQIVREIQKASKTEVAVGLLSGSVNDGQSIAEYAAYNEFGTDKTPSRPFMAMSVDENKAAIASDIERQGNRIVTGKATVNTALTIIGQKHADRIKNTIKNRDILPRLAESTVKGKKGSTKTLIDSGAMVNSVQISIRSK